MKPKLKTVLGVAILAGFAYVGILTGNNVTRIKKAVFGKEALKALDYLPEAALRIKNFHRVSIKDGEKEWELWGQEARYLKDDQQAVLIAPRMSLYPKSGPPISFESREGRVFFQGQEVVKMELTGGITLQHRDLDVGLEAATYDPKSQTLTSSSPVVAKGNWMEMHGRGMAIRFPEGKMVFEKGVKVHLYPNRKS